MNNAREYSQDLINNLVSTFKSDKSEYRDDVNQLLIDAEAKTDKIGQSSVVVGVVNARNYLEIVNIGNCGFIYFKEKLHEGDYAYIA